jgi:hypothetical protein
MNIKRRKRDDERIYMISAFVRFQYRLVCSKVKSYIEKKNELNWKSLCTSGGQLLNSHRGFGALETPMYF